MYKLEILQKLENLNDKLFDSSRIVILNLPAINYCEKRAEMTKLPNGQLEQACRGCVTQGIISKERLSIVEVKEIIDFFAKNYRIVFITINGRGNPFHPDIKDETIAKIKYATSKGIQSYIFTAGNNLDKETCKILAENKVNIMISLFGNQFIDADFFKGKKYDLPEMKHLQNKKELSENIRNLIKIYKDKSVLISNGFTRIGMNYVISEKDLMDEGDKIKLLKKEANKNGIFFICNTNFVPHPNLEIQKKLEKLSKEYSDFHLNHSTSVKGQCQMGSGSSATVDYNGELYRCPYMNGQGDGKFQNLSKKRNYGSIKKVYFRQGL